MLRQNLHSIALFGQTVRRHDCLFIAGDCTLRAATVLRPLCADSCASPHDALFFCLLLLHDLLALLEECFKVRRDLHHSTVQSVDACLYRLLVLTRHLLAHRRRRCLDLFRVNLNLGERVFYLDVELGNLVFARCKQRVVLLHYEQSKELGGTARAKLTREHLQWSKRR